MKSENSGSNPAHNSRPELTPQSKNWWETKLASRKLAMMWLLTAISGMLLISVVDSPVLRMLAPVGLLLVYAWYGYRYIKQARALVVLAQTRIGQLADSLYFLGFLWTLYALIDSFVIRSGASTLEAFGYALVATASGMFLRLFLLQFGYSEEEQMRAGEQTVEEEILRFTKTLKDGGDCINSFTKQMSQLNTATTRFRANVDETANHLGEAISAVVEVYKGNVQSMDRHVEVAINHIIEKFREELAKAPKSIEAVTVELHTSLSENLKVIGEDLTRFSDELRRIQLPPDAITKVLTDTLAAVSQRINGAIEPLLQAIKRVTQGLQSIEVKPDFIETALTEELGKITKQFKDSVSRFEEDMKGLGDRVKGIHVSDDIIQKAIEKRAGDLVRSVESRPIAKKKWWRFW